MLKGYMTTRQASDAYNLSDAHIRRLLEYGKAMGDRFGRDRLVRLSAMERYMSNRPREGPKVVK